MKGSNVARVGLGLGCGVIKSIEWNRISLSEVKDTRGLEG